MDDVLLGYIWDLELCDGLLLAECDTWKWTNGEKGWISDCFLPAGGELLAAWLWDGYWSALPAQMAMVLTIKRLGLHLQALEHRCTVN